MPLTLIAFCLGKEVCVVYVLMHVSLFMRVCFFLLSFAFLHRFVRAHISSRAVSVLSQAIFKSCSLQHALSPLPHFWKCLCGSVNPTLGKFPPLRLCFGELNLLLTETSATIKVSPVGGVMVLKGFACILEAGSCGTYWDVMYAVPPPTSFYCSWIVSCVT